MTSRTRSPIAGRPITRRDFIGATLVGTGAALLHAPCPAQAQQLGAGWTGYGGVGDYRTSNGNTADVVQSAHRIRDHAYEEKLSNVVDTGEQYDVVVVGAGFAGLTAMYEFKKRKPNGNCLLIDNHPIFGGFAKSNEFDVDGYRIAGPQASINFLRPASPTGEPEDWREFGLPSEFKFARLDRGDRSIVFAKGTSAPLYFGEQCATVGYYFENPLTHGKGVWVKNIWDGDLQQAPWTESFKKDLLSLRDRKAQLNEKEVAKDEAAYLDRITFADWVTRDMGLSREVYVIHRARHGDFRIVPASICLRCTIHPWTGSFLRWKSAGGCGRSMDELPGRQCHAIASFCESRLSRGHPRTKNIRSNCQQSSQPLSARSCGLRAPNATECDGG
jgi:spermidine dehydrogenase